MLIHIARVLMVSSLLLGSVVTGAIAATQISESKSFQVADSFGGVDTNLADQLKQSGCLSQRYNQARYFGSPAGKDIVRAAVTRLQRQNGLFVDGIAGSETFSALTNRKRCSFSQKEIDELFSLFKSAKQADRSNASATLSAIGELAKGSVPNVVNRLKSNNPIESFIAANVLLVIAEGEVTIPVFINLLKSDKADDRFIGTFLLYNESSQEFLRKNNRKDLRDALPTLITFIPDERISTLAKNDTVSSQTALVLSSMGTDAYTAIPALIDQLDLKRFQLNRPQNLGKNLGVLADALYSAFSTGKTKAKELYPTTEDLLRGLSSNNQKIRRAAAFVVGYKTAKEKSPMDIYRIDKEVLDKLLEIVKNPAEDMNLRKTSAISLMVFKQDVTWFFIENNLISILDKWKECPRSVIEARLASQKISQSAGGKTVEVAYFTPSTLSCPTANYLDMGDGLGAWFRRFLN